MLLVKITDLVNRLDISSRSLRYYEQAGLIRSVRSDFEKYRYYDNENIERLKQIMVLRKMQIPIKDIIRIYESEDMSVVVETFVSRIRAIDDEVDVLAELRSVVDNFLQAMIQNGVTKISALPILYEKMEKRLDTLERKKVMNYKELSNLSDRLAKPVETSIIHLPSMCVLSSNLKENSNVSDPDGFWRWVQTHGINPGEPGGHERFEFQIGAGDVTILKVSDVFINDTPFLDYTFEGGLFAAANIYLDEDLGERFRSLVSGFDANKYYEVDYQHNGSLRHEAMLENLISPDEKRELVSLLVPVKKRLSDPSLFEKAIEVKPGSITVTEIEAANPVLWSKDAAMDKLIPINHPHYRVTDEGEAEYISWISTRVLSTDISVKLPFRVDMVFRFGEESGGYGHGVNETSIRLYHGNHGPDHNDFFGVNMGNNADDRLSEEAIVFSQPIFKDYYNLPKRGGLNLGKYNRLTWIVGVNHLACVINDEVRYCGVTFPYMAVKLERQQPRPVIVGANSSIKIYFKSICVSQLVQTPKIKIEKGALAMVTKQSNNIIPNIRRLITDEYGENYWFNGCARYVMESLGEYKNEPDFGFWMFSGLTGDILAQVYSYNEYMGECVSTCTFNRDGGDYFEKIFDKCGYASTFVTGKQLFANKEMYIQTLMAYIDKGVPVIAVTHGGPPWGIYVGYEECGKTLLFLTGNKPTPERVPVELIIGRLDLPQHIKASSDEIHAAKGWVFVGEKKRAVNPAQVYRDVIINMPSLLTTKTDEYCFGAEAFRSWANGIENGKFDGVKPEDFDGWGDHVSNICNIATNGSCVCNFLDRAQELNPDFTFIEDIRKLYKRTAEIWNNDNGKDLEALGGGFNVTLEALQDKNRRGNIAAKIHEAADCIDEVVRILNENLK